MNRLLVGIMGIILILFGFMIFRFRLKQIDKQK